MPDLSIIIVNWNGSQMILDCLRSIPVAQKHLDLQVIVVDNNSSDGSREAAQREFPQYQIVNSGSNLGFGKGNNFARPLATAPLVLFLNPDTVLLENSLVPAVEHLRQHPDTGLLGCKMLYPDGQVQEQGIQYMPTPFKEFLNLMLISSHIRKWLRSVLPELDPHQSSYAIKLYGGYFMARREVLDQVGWFDERYFMYAEDADLCRTISAMGLKIYYSAETAIFHAFGGASEKASSGFAILMKHESIGKFMSKYHGRSGLVCYRFSVLLAAAIRILVVAVPRMAVWLGSAGRSSRFGPTLCKNWWMLLWALGLRRARIGQ